MLRKFRDVLLGFLILCAHPVSAEGSHGKTLSPKFGLSVVCLADPYESGWVIEDQFGYYSLLRHSVNEDEKNTAVNVNQKFRIVVENSQCFYEMTGHRNVFISHLFQASEGVKQLEIDGVSYPSYAPRNVLEPIVRKLRDRCDKRKFSEVHSLPSVSTRLKETLQEHCTSQVLNVLQFHSIYVYLDRPHLGYGDGLHFILGRPYFEQEELSPW